VIGTWVTVGIGTTNVAGVVCADAFATKTTAASADESQCAMYLLAFF
jgi:hypothetical protein